MLAYFSSSDWITALCPAPLSRLAVGASNAIDRLGRLLVASLRTLFAQMAPSSAGDGSNTAPECRGCAGAPTDRSQPAVRGPCRRGDRCPWPVSPESRRTGGAAVSASYITRPMSVVWSAALRIWDYPFAECDCRPTSANSAKQPNVRGSKRYHAGREALMRLPMGCRAPLYAAVRVMKFPSHFLWSAVPLLSGHGKCCVTTLALPRRTGFVLPQFSTRSARELPDCS